MNPVFVGFYRTKDGENKFRTILDIPASTLSLQECQPEVFPSLCRKECGRSEVLSAGTIISAP